MLPEQWETFKRAARREKMDKIPMALIIDSPWIPGYLGIRHLDYFLDPELWFQSNLKIMREFPGHHLHPLVVDGVRDGGGALGAGREDQVLAGQHAERVPHALSPGRYRQLSRIRSGGRRVCGADAAPHRHGAAADSGCRLHSAHGDLARAAVHGRICARHDEFHDRPGGESEGRAQADRPVHARDHRLAQGAAEGDGRHGGEHLHPRRHRGLRQRGALPGVRASLSEADLRRVSEGLGEALPQRRRSGRLPRPPARHGIQRAELGQAEGTSPK